MLGNDNGRESAPCMCASGGARTHVYVHKSTSMVLVMLEKYVNIRYI
jgi:hypothetical protein